MLNKISNEELKKFFEKKTGLPVTAITRYFGNATVILDKQDGKNFVTFQLSDTKCRAIPKERIGNMAELWQKFLVEQTEFQKQSYFTSKNSVEL